MIKFGSAILAAALASNAHANGPVGFDCAAATDAMTGTIPITLEDCNRSPWIAFAESTLGYNVQWTHIDATTADGYDVALIHITGDSNGQRLSYQGEMGPLLMLAGITGDGLEWWDVSVTNDPLALPSQKFIEGFDVYVGFVRGTQITRTHSDAGISQEDYWNFTLHEIGTYDIPAMVQAILGTRALEMAPCYKVQMLTHSVGAAQAHITLVEGAESEISNLINIAPCLIPNAGAFVDQSMLETPDLPDTAPVCPPGGGRLLSADTDIALDGSEREGRSLKSDRRRGRRLSH